MKSRLLGAVCAGYCIFVQMPAGAASFTIKFDDISDGILKPPFVGSGSFSFDGLATDGTFPLLSLENFSFDVDFSGDVFSNAHIATPLDEVLIVISGIGTQVNFANINGAGSGGYGGSIDFDNANNVVEQFISFEPSYGTPPLANRYVTDSFFGNYGTSSTVIPLPPAIWLFGSGVLGLIGITRRKKA